MTASSSSSACNTTAKAGNACRACSVMGSLYTCSGGTTCPKLKSVTCSAGTYLPAGKTSCSTCTAGYKCPGGTFTASATVTQGRTRCTANYRDGAAATSEAGCAKNCISQSIVGGVNTPVSDSVNYPASCTYTTVCDDGYNLTGTNPCSQLCTLGVTSLRTGNGVTIPLYSSALSTPSLNIGTGGGVCYGILESGAGTLNIQYDGKTYHAVD